MFRTGLAAIVAFALAAASPLSAQTHPPVTITAPPAGFAEVLPLWPAGDVPLAQGTTNGHIPRLYTYPAPGRGPHPAVIVMPGGGYIHIVMEKEGASEARWLNARGVSAFVLEYRLAPAYLAPAPLLDGARAVRYVRANAVKLGVDPRRIGVWGFSAGGHLSGYLAAVHTPGDPSAADPVERVTDRPDFAILSYARLTLDPAIPTSIASGKTAPMQPLLGPHPTQAEIDAIDPVRRVDATSSPSFIYSTGGDQTVDPLNAAVFYEALHRAHVPAELHIFERGVHGSGLGDNASKAPTPAPAELAIWPTLLAHWMQQNDWMPTP